MPAYTAPKRGKLHSNMEVPVETFPTGDGENHRPHRQPAGPLAPRTITTHPCSSLIGRGRRHFAVTRPAVANCPPTGTGDIPARLARRRQRNATALSNSCLRICRRLAPAGLTRCQASHPSGSTPTRPDPITQGPILNKGELQERRTAKARASLGAGPFDTWRDCTNTAPDAGEPVTRRHAMAPPQGSTLTYKPVRPMAC